ncbi:MAG: cryptochrome/photolyase family protein [Burkholderiales bacterium]|jgi:deoxyribodipyrimidine photolyase-related protein|nr:cryptochrome/photolyase family protein [Burkholderiales bacterium]
MRNLVLLLGDQLDADGAALGGFDPGRDRVLMIESRAEATHVWSHKARIVLFLSAMRHFAEMLRSRGWPVSYLATDDPAPAASLADGLITAIREHRPERVVACEPGELRVRKLLEQACRSLDVRLELRPDAHFLCSGTEFADWAGKRKTLRMEFFYREMRRRHGILLEDGAPAGGRWNFDAANRSAFPKDGPPELPQPPRFVPDRMTRDVIAMVGKRYAEHPGTLDGFHWPVTRGDAQAALADFIEHRLPGFGSYQDAMWTDMPFGWHSLLSAALNLKLLNPREVIAAAVEAWQRGRAPLPAVEGFVRQVLGWREFIRGVYWLDMPRLLEANHFGHDRPLPDWYWSGETQMNCLRQAIGQTLRHGYAHHIQRLMVTGNFALLAGLQPRAVHEWYLAVYVDAVEWAELPNTAGMALYANGGRFTSKPYISSGAYIGRMSNYCRGCRYDPKLRSGPRACPFTVLYWNFLDRNEAEFAGNPRTVLMARNIARFDAAERRAIRQSADRILATIPQL